MEQKEEYLRFMSLISDYDGKLNIEDEKEIINYQKLLKYISKKINGIC